jgi:hypothetical protein
MRDWVGDWAEWRRELATAVLLGLFLGAIGPFGTFLNGSLEIRLAYWVGMCVFGLVVYSLGVRWALHWGERLRQPDWFMLPLAVLVISAPMCLVTSSVVLALWPGVRAHMQPFDWYAQAVVMSLPLAAATVWARRTFPVRPSPSLVPAAQRRNFLDRLPPRLGRTLLCLQMEDHYVRAHTDRGSDLVLIPLRAALAELGELGGLQVHRSWWVARDAVVEPVQDGRNLRLRLANGLEAPVSRAYVGAVRAAGWLDGVSPP